MNTIIQGQEIFAESVDVAIDGKVVMGVDLASLPAGTPITQVRRNFAVVANHIYQFVTEFIDIPVGGVKQITSRVTLVSATGILNQGNTVGTLESPLSVRLIDVTPVFPVAPPTPK